MSHGGPDGGRGRLRARARRLQGHRAPPCDWPRPTTWRARPAGRASATPGWPPSPRSPPRAAHPFSVGPDQCLVHNGSFSNHATDPPRAASARACGSTPRTTPRSAPGSSPARLARGRRPREGAAGACARPSTASTRCSVGTADGFAVVRDPIACKPAVDGRDRRLGGDGLRVPRARRAARHRATPASASPSPGRSTHGTVPVTDGHRDPTARRTVDLARRPVRELNAALHDADAPRARTRSATPAARTRSPSGLDAEIEVEIEGHVGYYCAGMNKRRHGHRRTATAGTGVAENMMSGHGAWSTGDASPVGGRDRATAACSSIEGNASARCGISMKGVDIVVGGSVGHMSAFMAQAGSLVVLRRRRRGAGRLASTRRGSTCAATVGEPRRRLRREGDARRAPRASSPSCWPRRARRTTRRSSAATARRAQLYNFHVDNVGVLTGATDDDRIRPARAGLRESATFDRATIAEIQRAAATGIYDIRGCGAKRARPALRRPAVPRRLDVALPAGGLPRALRHRRRARRPPRHEADRTSKSRSRSRA